MMHKRENVRIFNFEKIKISFILNFFNIYIYLANAFMK